MSLYTSSSSYTDKDYGGFKLVESESEQLSIVELQSEDSNVVSPLELDVLVHVEEEHEHEVESNS